VVVRIHHLGESHSFAECLKKKEKKTKHGPIPIR